jgi:hypothetical protein
VTAADDDDVIMVRHSSATIGNNFPQPARR